MKRVSLKNRLMLGAVVICSIITLGISFYQISGLQQRDLELAQREIDTFQQSALTSLREALWNYDWHMVEIIVSSQVNSVLARIEVCDAGAINCIVSDQSSGMQMLEQQLPITYQVTEHSPGIQIGTVSLGANFKSFSVLINEHMALIVMTNGLWVFGVAISVFLLFHVCAIRRLEQVEEFTRNIDLTDVEKLPPLAYTVDSRARDEVDMLAVAVIDLTDRIKEEFVRRRQLEQQLNQTQKMEALGTLAGGIAHDFNNILAAILGYSQLCLNSAEKGSPMHNRLEQVVAAGQRAKSLISQILIFSRKSEAYTDTFCLAGVVVEALDLINAALPETVVVETDLDEGLWIAGDDSQLHQVVMNLATNAVFEMADTGGSLRVSVRLQELEREQADQLGLNEGSYVQLNFCDDGPGVAEEIRERIFDPFFTTKKTAEGTGMGLAVVHGITQAHGGRIFLDQECDKGACFQLYFPLAKKSVIENCDSAVLLAKSQDHLLLVDDESVILNMGRDMLESLGYRVTTCLSPADALQRVKDDQSIALVITDLSMPDLSGIELAEEVKKMHPQLPVLLWSGYADMDGQQSLDNEIINSLLHKPFTLQALAQAVYSELYPSD